MSKPKNVAELIEKLTPAALADALGMSVQGVSNMKQRGAIPPKHHYAVAELAKQSSDEGLADFTFDDLRQMHSDRGQCGQRVSPPANHQRRNKRNPWQSEVA